MEVLDRAQVEEFDARGYVVFTPGIDEAVLDEIVQGIGVCYPRGSFANGRYAGGTRAQDAWRFHRGVAKLATCPAVLAGLRQLYGRTALPFQTLNFPVGTEQPAHSDTIHFNSVPSGYVAGVWVALEDVDETNGSLVYYPGSHKLREYTMQDCGSDIGYEHYRDYEQFVRNLIDELGLRPQTALLKKGQALVWHGNLLHGGSPQRDKTRSRHSQVTHYYFEGCRYYTPMSSRPDEKQYRSPVWVVDRGPLAMLWKRASLRARRFVRTLAGARR